MASDNIFQQYLSPPKSMMEYSADLDAADQRKQVLKQNALALAAGQQKFDESVQSTQRQTQVRNALAQLAAGATDDDRIRVMRGTSTPEGFTAADSLEKSLAERGKAKAGIAKDEAATAETNLKRNIMLHDYHAQKLAQVQTPDQAIAWAKDGLDAGIGTPEQYERGLAMIQQAARSPETFAEWRQRAMQGGQSVTEQLKAQHAQNVLAETTRNNKEQNATSRANNAATVGASYANAAATRSIASATRDAASIQRDQATEMKLGDDYRAQSKGFKEVADAHRQITATLDKATTSPAATLAAATKFMKLLDPGSVVRESELGMALAASGVLDRATNYFNVLQSGRVLTPNQVKDFKNITQQIYGAAQAGQRAIDSNYKRQAEQYKLRPEMIVQDLGQNASSAPGADADIHSQADAILRGK